MEKLSRARLLEIMDAWKSVTVGVIGDFTLDAYWYADMTLSQLSRETPLFPRPVVRETYSPGGAANVAWNLADLQVGQVKALTVFGEDWRGDLLRRSLQKSGVDLGCSLVSPEWSTPLFGKVFLSAHNQMQEDARLDFVNTQSISTTVEAHLMEQIQAALPQLHALVVADYQPNGVFTPDMRASLNTLAEDNPAVFFIADSRQHVGSYPAMIIKPNEIEAAGLFFPGQAFESLELTEIAAASALRQAKTGKLVYITLGERGSLLLDGGPAKLLPAVRVPPPIDTVGAGDTYLACLATCLAAGATPWEAGTIATLATAVTIRILRLTGTASPAQILDQYDQVSQAEQSSPEHWSHP